MLPVRARQMDFLGAAVDRADRSIPMSESIQHKTVIIVNAPFDIMASHIQVMRASGHRPRPRHLHWLSTAGSPLAVTRSGDRQLSIKPRSGFLYTPLERHWRGEPSALKKGRVVRLSEMDVEITSMTSDGRPQKARFTFDAVLDSERYLFLYWYDGEYRPFNLPKPGETVRLPAEDFFLTVISSVLDL
jgi:hypothetical protein